ncbi:unnamed protein product [Dibothriocephalus latus]|uniref:Uncharacterized protein n=1 Tax=Dibothriocephalus latus TaxID=60516 RepID=A0A3P7L899_DIBLA|nr:unnamed protein product [Dibothriocephalus latus]
MRDTKAQLAEARCSASDLAARFEGILQEKDELKKRISLLEAEKADLDAAGGLLKQRVEAQERQIDEMRLQLADSTKEAQKAHSEREESAFERRNQAVQYTSLFNMFIYEYVGMADLVMEQLSFISAQEMTLDPVKAAA